MLFALVFQKLVCKLKKKGALKQIRKLAIFETELLSIAFK